ncbi:unnamed protein product, partial [Amoebophrya sp. A25]|eukprot:GSA25T00012564001.1
MYNSQLRQQLGRRGGQGCRQKDVRQRLAQFAETALSDLAQLLKPTIEAGPNAVNDIRSRATLTTANIMMAFISAVEDAPVEMLSDAMLLTVVRTIVTAWLFRFTDVKHQTKAYLRYIDKYVHDSYKPVELLHVMFAFAYQIVADADVMDTPLEQLHGTAADIAERLTA